MEKDKTTLKEQKSGTFISNSLYTKTFLPPSISAETPIHASYGQESFDIFPLSGKIHHGKLSDCVNAFDQERQAIVYKKFFGSGIDYVCYPTSFGINTEIILKKKPKNNNFQFKLTLPTNLIPDTGSPDYILFKNNTSNAVEAILYTPMAIDKKGNWNYYNWVQLVENDSTTGTYFVEYNINKDFLNDKETKYPVKLNQSVYLYESIQPLNPVYSDTGDTAGHYLSPYILLGDSTQKGEGCVYVRYETLDILDIDADKIISAKWVFRNISDLKNEVKISAYAVTEDWCSINTRWFNQLHHDETLLCIAKLSKREDYEIDITPLLKEMIKNTMG